MAGGNGVNADPAREAELLRRDRLGFNKPKLYKVRVTWTEDQHRIEAQASMLGLDPAVYLFRCALLVTRRLEDWRELVQEDGR